MKKRRSNRLQKRNNMAGYLFLAPACIILFVVLLLPLLYSLVLSFFDWNFIYDTEGATFNGIGNYIDILTDESHLYSFGITILYVFVSVTLELILGFSLALLFNGTGRVMQVIRTFVVFPMMIAEVVAALIFRYILNADFGLVNYLLSLIGIHVTSWTDITMAFPTIVMIEVWQQTPFVILIILAGLQVIPEEIYEAANMDGCSWWSRLRYITIPYVKPQILVALVFRTMFCLRVFTQPWVLTGGGPADRTMVIGIDIYNEAFRYFEFGKANALSWLLVLVTIIFVVIYIRALGKDNMES